MSFDSPADYERRLAALETRLRAFRATSADGTEPDRYPYFPALDGLTVAEQSQPRRALANLRIVGLLVFAATILSGLPLEILPATLCPTLVIVGLEWVRMRRFRPGATAESSP